MKTALYRHFDQAGTLLYVGISVSVMERLKQHRQKSNWVSEIASMTIEYFDSRPQAELAEKAAIIAELPLWNMTHHPAKIRKPYQTKKMKSRLTLLEKRILLHVLDRQIGSEEVAISAADLSLRYPALKAVMAELLYQDRPWFYNWSYNDNMEQVRFALYPSMRGEAEKLRVDIASEPARVGNRIIRTRTTS